MALYQNGSKKEKPLFITRLLRRDQIWFTQKDTLEQTDLYSMIDIVLPDGSQLRNDANFENHSPTSDILCHIFTYYLIFD